MTTTGEKIQLKLIGALDNLYGDMVRGVTDDEVIQSRLKNIIKQAKEKKNPVTKRCPLIRDIDGSPMWCLRERCTWWMFENGPCAIHEIAMTLDVMAVKEE